jgi:hypothetical protein
VAVVLIVVLCGCDTLANRRRFYAPKKGEGYWTRTLEEGTWKKRGVKPAGSTPVKRSSARPVQAAPAASPAVSKPAPAPANEPVAMPQ